ncbi:MAG: glutamate mutase L [Candidatus Nanopelagicales bacterium]
MGRAVVVCVDVGSTFTKAAAVGPDGSVRATAQHATTSGSDVLHGVDAAVAGLGIGPVADEALVVCSSAGGGLRLAVIGQERVISAEAGRRVALSAGARVVAVSAGRLDAAGLCELSAARADVVLVVGGTDGGDGEVLLHNARVLGRSALRTPVVLAGNTTVADEAAALLRARRRVVHVSANVIPRIGTLAPGPARRTIREVFIAHVIGGKGLSRGRRFPGLVRCATPDAVLAGIEVLAEVLAEQPGASGDVLALDVGGATTDVYSVLAPDEQADEHAVATLWHGRSVEGDLGMRWSAPDVVRAAQAEQLVAGASGVIVLSAAAERRHAEVGFLPSSGDEVADELELARLAALVAVRRHGRPGPDGVRDLTHVGLLIGSGGVLRHAASAAADAVLDTVLTDYAGGWPLPQQARTMVDRRYLLAPIGLLALAGEGQQARRLAADLLSEQLGPAGDWSGQATGPGTQHRAAGDAGWRPAPRQRLS